MRLEALVSPRFCLHAGGRRADLGTLVARARELAPAMRRLGAPGSVIAVPAGDPIEFLATLEAVWRADCAALPLAAATAPYRMDLPATAADLVVRTSGSTGVRRYPAFTGRAVLTSAATIAAYLRLTPADRVALLQPLEHSFGLVGQLFAAASAGCTAYWTCSPFIDERVEIIEGAGITAIAAVPFLLSQLLDFGLEAGSIRSIGSAGGPLPRHLAEALTTAFPEATVWNQYGCTEAGPRLTACPSTHAAYVRGSVGRAIDGVLVHTTADDRIAFESPMAMFEYLGDPEATAAARCGAGFYTGDIGHFDPDGNLVITGRRDDIIKLRGLKVSLQAVAAAMEAVGASAATAFVLPADGPTTASDPILCGVFEGRSDICRSALAERLPLHSLPQRLHRVTALPRLPSGKIDRQAIAAVFHPTRRMATAS